MGRLRRWSDGRIRLSRENSAPRDLSEIEIEPTRVYGIEDARQFLAAKGIDVDAIAPDVEGKFASAFIRARKPIEAAKA